MNDILLNGPKIQKNLISTLIKWRQFKYVYVADAAKMFRQIWVHFDDRKYQKILWRFSPKENIQTYILNTVTYGTKPASFLSVRTIKQLAIDESSANPEISNIIQDFMYMDDLLGGANDLNIAQAQAKGVYDMFLKGGFLLGKWSTNNSVILKNIPQEYLLENMNEDSSDNLKILGLNLNLHEDQFVFNIKIKKIETFSKRNILSEIASIYDPIGFFQPVIIVAKITMQQLWLEKTGWDEIPSKDILEKYHQFRNNITALVNIAIPRQVIFGIDNSEIFGFSDAAELELVQVFKQIFFFPKQDLLH